MIHPVDETLRELIVKNIQLLINEGANPNTQDRMGKTPLHLVVNLSTYSRMPNIIASFRKLKADLIQLLLNAGADPNILDRRGLTPFSEAVSLSDNRNYATTPIQLMIDSGKVSYENAHSALQRTRSPQIRQMLIDYLNKLQPEFIASQPPAQRIRRLHIPQPGYTLNSCDKLQQREEIMRELGQPSPPLTEQ